MHALCVSIHTFNFFQGHPYLWCTTLHHYIGYCRLLAECSCSKYEWLQETHMASIVNALWSFHTRPLESHLTFFYIAILDTIFLIIYCLMQNEVFRKLPCIQCKTTLLPSTAKLGKCILLVAPYVGIYNVMHIEICDKIRGFFCFMLSCSFSSL